MKNDIIIPSIKNPVFICYNDHVGRISLNRYKDWFIKKLNVTGETWAVDYVNAINFLHSWIKENPEIIKEYPKSKFVIEVIDGRIKNDEAVFKKIYTINAVTAKKYILKK